MRKISLIVIAFVVAAGVGHGATIRRRAVGRPAAPPKQSNSFQLIQQALAQGKLDSETALIYEVYAAFGDDRLPSEFRGDDSAIVDSLVMGEVRSRWQSLSPATQQLLGPFLIPPAYEGSALLERAATGVPLCGSLRAGWQSLDTLNGQVRIWWSKTKHPEDAVQAQFLAEQIDNLIWDKLKTLFGGRVPVSDLGESCNGGDGRLDIYLSESVKRTMATPYHDCSPTAVYIVAARDTGKQTITHELAHAFQNAYTFAKGGCLISPEYRWWGEATAQWTMDYVYPDPPGEQAAAPEFLEHPEMALDTFNDGHEYGAYLFPFFIHRKLGDVGIIRQAWENTKDTDAVEAIDRALPGKFEKIFPEFAVDNWNRDAFNDYERWDKLTIGAKPAAEATLVNGGVPDEYVDIGIDLPRLSATYRHYIFTPEVRSVAFLNGLTFKLSTKSIPIFPAGQAAPFYTFSPASALSAKGASVQALIKRNGRWEPAADWSSSESVTFCRQKSDERIEELVLIFANSDTDRGRQLRPEGLPPILIASNMACSGWEGSNEITVTGPQLLLADVDWKIRASTAVKPSLEGYDRAGFQYTISGTGEAKIDQSVGDCTARGRGTVTPGSAMPPMAVLFAPKGSAAYRTVFLSGVSTDLFPVTISCPGGSQSTSGAAATCLASAHVGSDGATIEDRQSGNILNGVEGTCHWSFHAIDP